MSLNKIKICILLATRGNYGKTKSLIHRLVQEGRAELNILITGSLAEHEYGLPVNLQFEDSIDVDKVKYLAEGSSYLSIGQSAGSALQQAVLHLTEKRPDYVFLIGDRYEVLSFALAATVCNLKIIHLEGGELSGSIDERIRHSISKLSHLHFVACRSAAKRLIQMGECPSTVHVVGSPNFDLVNREELVTFKRVENAKEYLCCDGSDVDLFDDYILVSLHPTFARAEFFGQQVRILCSALSRIGISLIWVLPNADAGYTEAKPIIENFKLGSSLKIGIHSAVDPEIYWCLLANSLVIVGNSSSGIRESEFLGLRSVNIGDRQANRERGGNVVDVEFQEDDIVDAIRSQLERPMWLSRGIYGDGESCEKMVERIYDSKFNSADKVFVDLKFECD